MSKRRGKGEGSIAKRSNGLWEARFTLGNGKRKSIYAKTRQEAYRRLTDAVREQENGISGLDERQTSGTYLMSWLSWCKPTVKPRTWVRYEQLVRVHVVPEIGKIELRKLTPQHIQSLYTQKLASNLSPTTVRHMHAVLHAAIDKAVRLGLVMRNVTDMVDPPRMHHREIRSLSEGQARTLLEAAAGDRNEALYVLALTTGMRQGELLALRWRDVDLDGGRVQGLHCRISEGIFHLLSRRRRAVDAT